MLSDQPDYSKSLPQDLLAGVVVLLVALPLCLGIALASNAPVMSGIVAAVVGGVLVAWLSGSQTSISGPTAGLAAVVATQIDRLGSFDIFLVAVVLAGLIQLALGLVRAGSVAAFFPASVIRGLLAGVGIILILKQLPHLFGHDADWFGNMSFRQADGETTFSEIFSPTFELRPGPTAIGLASLALLLIWNRTPLAKWTLPAPLIVAIGGIAMAIGLDSLGGRWEVRGDDLVQVPVAASFGAFLGHLHTPDFASLRHGGVALAALTVALVASLETLINIEAIDKLDPEKRHTPPNRELVAQGVGNITSGLLGGLPITSVVVRSSVGLHAGAKTRVTAFVYGLLLFGFVVAHPEVLNRIPLASLAAILMVTGFKLASPSVFRQMFAEGRSQFLPFIGTVAAVVFTDLLVGVAFGLVFATGFILYNSLDTPVRKFREAHTGGDALRIELANQLTFLNRAALVETLRNVPDDTQLILDARSTNHMDSDIVDLIREFEEEIAPAHGINLSLVGFGDQYKLSDRIAYEDVSTQEVQQRTSPEQIIQMLVEGNRRFMLGQQTERDSRRQVASTASGQFPLAVVLACMDSRIATELIFDRGLGDLFSIRVAGNIASEDELGSMEYGCAVAGAKVLLVMGHTRCGAVMATIDLIDQGSAGPAAAECENLPAITNAISEAVRAETTTTSERNSRNEAFSRRVATLNVHRTMRVIRERSSVLRRLIDEGSIRLVGAICDVATGRVEFLDREDQR